MSGSRGGDASSSSSSSSSSPTSSSSISVDSVGHVGGATYGRGSALVGQHRDGEQLDHAMGDVNGNGATAKAKGISGQPLTTLLSDAGRFAYCGLVTSSLQQLFTDNPQDLDWSLITLNSLGRRLELPRQVLDIMEMTLRGEVEASSCSSYVDVLKGEPPLAKGRLALVQDLVLFAVHGGCYDARVRVLINHVTCLLHVSTDLLELYEESVLEYLTSEGNKATEEEEKESKKASRIKKFKRYTMIGMATLGGGAVLGLTGGLAAPFIGAGLGTIIGAGGVAALSSTAGAAVVGSLFGVAGAGLTGFKMQKRVGEVEEFAFDFLTDGSNLHITIAISGWLTEEGPEAFSKPWQTLYNSREQYCLRYESAYLLELGQAMDYLLQFAFSMAVQESLKYTILAGIISAIVWPASLVTLASVIDNPWGVCCRRSAEVGRQLAQVLVKREHGRRPVTLIGFSLGARVIYYCLKDLSQMKGSAGIVQDAILLGAPVPGYENDWKEFASVVSGRIINGYCQGDWLLRFLYRTSSGSLRIAGLMPVEWKDRRMFNFDLSDIVDGHTDYAKKMDLILRLLGMRTRNVSKDDPRVKKSASDYPGFMKREGSMDHFGTLRYSQSDSNLVCGNCCATSGKRSSDIGTSSGFGSSELLGSSSGHLSCDHSSFSLRSNKVEWTLKTQLSSDLSSSDYLSASEQGTPSSIVAPKYDWSILDKSPNEQACSDNLRVGDESSFPFTSPNVNWTLKKQDSHESSSSNRILDNEQTDASNSAPSSVIMETKVSPDSSNETLSYEQKSLLHFCDTGNQKVTVLPSSEVASTSHENSVDLDNAGNQISTKPLLCDTLATSNSKALNPFASPAVDWNLKIKTQDSSMVDVTPNTQYSQSFSSPAVDWNLKLLSSNENNESESSKKQNDRDDNSDIDYELERLKDIKLDNADES